jgi:hypothetical protein
LADVLAFDPAERAAAETAANDADNAAWADDRDREEASIAEQRADPDPAEYWDAEEASIAQHYDPDPMAGAHTALEGLTHGSGDATDSDDYREAMNRAFTGGTFEEREVGRLDMMRIGGWPDDDEPDGEELDGGPGKISRESEIARDTYEREVDAGASWDDALTAARVAAGWDTPPVPAADQEVIDAAFAEPAGPDPAQGMDAAGSAPAVEAER